MAPIATQILVKRRTQHPLRGDWFKSPRTVDTPTLYSQDIAGFLIFLAVVCLAVMISLYA